MNKRDIAIEIDFSLCQRDEGALISQPTVEKENHGFAKAELRVTVDVTRPGAIVSADLNDVNALTALPSNVAANDHVGNRAQLSRVTIVRHQLLANDLCEHDPARHARPVLQ